MSNFSVNLNLKALKNAFVKKMKKKDGTLIDVLIIPIVDNTLFVGEKGIYLDLQAVEVQNRPADRKDTHIVKQSFPKAVYNAMTEEQRKASPILGNAILWNGAPATTPNIDPNQQQPPATNGGQQQFPDEDDLPF